MKEVNQERSKPTEARITERCGPTDKYAQRWRHPGSYADLHAIVLSTLTCNPLDR